MGKFCNGKRRISLMLCCVVFAASICFSAAYHALAQGGLPERTTSLDTWSVNSDESRVWYGERTKAYSIGHMQQPFDKDNLMMENVTINGLHVSLAPQDVFTYNKVIDLNALDENTPVFNFGVMPDDGQRDAQFIYFQLTDAYDPTITMSIRISSGLTNPESLVWANSWTIYSYLMAKTGKQIYAGYGNGTVELGVNNHIYGSIAKFGLYGNRSGNKMGTEYLAVYYDSEEKQLYEQSINGRVLICDFDDSAFFSTPFSGFTTGEVILSMYATNYYTPSFNVYFNEIAGETEFGETFNDYAGLRICMELPEEKYNGLVGYAYPIYPVRVLDAYGKETELVTEVIFGDGSSSAYNVPMKDGTFTPEHEGLYTIRYTASNELGVTATETVEVLVRAADYNNVELGKLTDEKRYVGERIKLRQPEVKGGIGQTEVSVSVTLDEEEIEVKDGTFRPVKAGDYQISYTAQDYFGRSTKCSYIVKATVSDVPVIDEDTLVLPRYFIKGESYTLPSVYAYDYADKGAKKDCRLSVLGGSLSEKLFIPDADAAEITYIVEKNGKKSEVKAEVPVIDVSGAEAGSIDIAKYFVNENLQTVSTEESITFERVENQKEASLSFLNKFVAGGFYCTLQFPANTEVGMQAALVLSDSVNGKKLELVFTREENGVSLSYQGKEEYLYDISERIMLAYNKFYNRIETMDTIGFELEDFVGFESGYLYFDMVFRAADKHSAVMIYNLSGQSINNIGYDNIKPDVASAENYSFHTQLDDTIMIYPANAADALNPNTVATVTVMRPSGKAASAADGTLLENVSADKTYEVKADEYGYYIIIYNAVSGGQNNRANYSILVEDTQAPKIEVKGSVPKELEKGKELVIPEAKLSDNVDSSETVVCLCMVEKVSTHRIDVYSPGERVIFDTAGIYRLTYVATDSAGNTTMQEYSIFVP